MWQWSWSGVVGVSEASVTPSLPPPGHRAATANPPLRPRALRTDHEPRMTVCVVPVGGTSRRHSVCNAVHTKRPSAPRPPQPLPRFAPGIELRTPGHAGSVLTSSTAWPHHFRRHRVGGDTHAPPHTAGPSIHHRW